MPKTIHFIIVGLLGLFPNTGLTECLDEVRALYSGGPLDPFQRPNRREITIALHPDGTTSPISDVLWDGPVKSRNCYAGGCAMNIGSVSWTAPNPEGPWTEGGDPYGGVDPETFARQTTERHAASINKAECLGEVDLDGKPMLAYRFSSKTEPNEFGAWWGGEYSLWLDVDTRQLIKMEIAGFYGSWAPEPSKDLQIMTVEIDETILLDPPK